MTAKNGSALPTCEENDMPVTSYLCQWKVPKKRKESNICMSTAVFEKHDYQKTKKRKVRHIEDFDPRPAECRNTAQSLLPALLNDVYDESLGVSFLFDKRCCRQSLSFTSTEIPALPAIKNSVSAFKDSLKMSERKLREIEQNTRGQRQSYLWYSVRRYRITSSFFGIILRRKIDTPPDRLVTRILYPQSFSSVAVNWGIQNESRAIESYVLFQQGKGRENILVGPCGFLISESHPYLGATPDGTVHDPSDLQHPFGFIEVKCPYSNRDRTPVEACSSPGFCCNLVTHPDGSQTPQLRRNHIYFAQVQGQMAVGKRLWCDFVVYTNKGISVERVQYEEDYWKNTLLPKLEAFYDNCLGPEIISPLHALGLPMRNLATEKQL